MLATAKALQSDLERLGSERRKRSRVHSHSQSRNLEISLELALEIGPGLTLEAGLEIMLQPTVKVTLMVTYRDMHPWSPNEPLPRRRVTFHDPRDEKDPAKEEVGYSTEPSIDDLETWLEFLAGKLGTPTWWEELGAMPVIEDWCKFAQKIRASLYVPEVRFRASLERGYTTPPAPQSLNRSALLLERLTYQDMRTAASPPDNS